MMTSLIFLAFQIDIDLSKRKDQRLVVGLILLFIIFIVWLVNQFKSESISHESNKRYEKPKTAPFNNPPPKPQPPPTYHSTARLEAERILRERQARINSTPPLVIQPTSKDDALNLFGIPASSSQEQIQNAYHELIKKYHPDKVSHLGDEFRVMAEEKTKAINQAYKLLTTTTEQAIPPKRPSKQRKSEDELFDQAVKIAVEMGRLSTAVLQRRLSIGYGRAAKILNMMEQQGLISPPEGYKPRKVLQAAYDYVANNSD